MTKSREWLRLGENERSLIEAQQKTVPVNLSAIATALGLKVKGASLKPGISGELRPDLAGGYVARVNRHESRKRQRFTVAHEISHFLLHKDQVGTGITDDALFRSELSNSVEAEANRLAAEILMPTKLVTRAVAAAKALGSEDIVTVLAEQFQVSEQAMAIKLEGMGIGIKESR